MKSITELIKESSCSNSEKVLRQITDLAAELSTVLQTELVMFNSGELDEYFPDESSQKEKKVQIKACEKGLDALQGLLAAYEY